MEKIRDSSFFEFKQGFLAKYYSERPYDGGWPEHQNDDGWLTSKMCQEHSGKIDQRILWCGQWSEMRISEKPDIGNLVCLASDWTRDVGLLRNNQKNCRLLSTFVKNAREIDYFKSEDSRRTHWLDKFRKSVPEFTGYMRIVLRQPDNGEKNENPDGTYYLHDGLGRMLPLLYMMEYEGASMPLIHALVVRSS